jgi:inosose dehydratase
VSAHLAFSPLPYYLATGALRPDLAPPLTDILHDIAMAGYAGVPAEIPEGMTPADYLHLLGNFALGPAPGYFQGSFGNEDTLPQVREAALRLAGDHAALGLDRIFIAETFPAPARFRKPAVGADADADRLERISDGLAQVAADMVGEGVVPCLHPHVGTFIETAEEACFLLDRIPPRLLKFGPDFGHLTWAGADPLALLERYHDRIGSAHLKEIHMEVAHSARAQGLDYGETTARTVWTTPGHGDVDYEAVLRALEDFDGWLIVEVDIADRPTVAETAHYAAEWLKPRLVA